MVKGFKIKEQRGETKTTKILKQVGTSNQLVDAARSALLPGKRTTAWGTVYWETRKNRSDAAFKKT